MHRKLSVGGRGSGERKVLKCGDFFCSNSEVKDTKECKSKKKKMHHTWRGVCFWQSVGSGCKECGGKAVRASGIV